ncbi:hypothetical protein VaNZ11_014519, partial [Volvox africanus]
QGLARLGGCVEVQRGKAYPGWQPDLDSKVLKVTLDAYRDMLGGNQTAKVGAIHAGLECGILGEKFPGMDMVSFGPTIKGAPLPGRAREDLHSGAILGTNNQGSGAPRRCTAVTSIRSCSGHEGTEGNVENR